MVDIGEFPATRSADVSRRDGATHAACQNRQAGAACASTTARAGTEPHAFRQARIAIACPIALLSCLAACTSLAARRQTLGASATAEGNAGRTSLLVEETDGGEAEPNATPPAANAQTTATRSQPALADHAAPQTHTDEQPPTTPLRSVASSASSQAPTREASAPAYAGPTLAAASRSGATDAYPPTAATIRAQSAHVSYSGAAIRQVHAPTTPPHPRVTSAPSSRSSFTNSVVASAPTVAPRGVRAPTVNPAHGEAHAPDEQPPTWRPSFDRIASQPLRGTAATRPSHGQAATATIAVPPHASATTATLQLVDNRPPLAKMRLPLVPGTSAAVPAAPLSMSVRPLATPARAAAAAPALPSPSPSAIGTRVAVSPFQVIHAWLPALSDAPALRAAATVDAFVAATPPAWHIDPLRLSHGDLVVFDHLIGYVTAVSTDGVATFFYIGAGVLRRGFVCPAHPNLKRLENGAIANTFLRHAAYNGATDERLAAARLRTVLRPPPR